MGPKPVYTSKTLWVNVSALVAAVSGYFTGTMDLATALTAAVMAVMNIVLRLVTKQPVGTPEE